MSLPAEINEKLQQLVHFIDFRFSQATQLDEVRDCFLATGSALRRARGIDPIRVEVRTTKPIAYESPDHTTPWGTKQDNHTSLKFIKKLADWFPLESLSVLDIGCSGGGFVKSLWDMGCLAVGLEGSDYSKIRGRAEWATIPHLLFTADATAPFEVVRKAPHYDTPLKFRVITGWEFIEHIAKKDLPAVFANFDRHLETGGVIVLSVCPDDDIIDGVNLHQTVEPPKWWYAEVKRLGFTHHPELISYFGTDWVRTEGNSFYLVLTRQGESLPYADRLPKNGGNAQ